MKQYKIYSRSEGAYIAVKQGWSWPAFLFGLVWAMTKRMWGISIGLIFLAVISAFISSRAGLAFNFLFNIIFLIISIEFGHSGNRWRENNLLERGYVCTGEIIQGKNPKDAVSSYMRLNNDRLFEKRNDLEEQVDILKSYVVVLSNGNDIKEINVEAYSKEEAENYAEKKADNLNLPEDYLITNCTLKENTKPKIENN